MSEKNTIFESVGDFFGLEIKKKKEKLLPSFVAPQTDDGALEISSSMAGSFGQYVDTGEQLRNDHELVNKYRDMALQSEIELAISDIVNEAIVIDEEELPVTINTDEIEFSTKIKNSIGEEFETILELLNFNNRGYDIFRQWYIDGRLFYHVIVDENKKGDGIQELRNIDPRKIKKVREVKKNVIRTAGTVTANIIDDIEEFFVYNKDGFVNAEVGLKINPDAVVFVPSGILDVNNKLVLGYLHKAIRPLNNLKIMEDSLVVYRIARAPERRVFYIDVGNLPRPKAELYVATVMAKFKNKTVYDATTGEVKDDKRYMCLDMNTKVPLLDGRTLTIDEISKEYRSGKTLWAYSCDSITGKFVPGLISWAGVTRKDAEVMKLTLDNGKEIVCTPDHKFPVWSKGNVEAKDLSVGESMIPHYREGIKFGKNTYEYELLFKNDTKKWDYTHRIVSEWKDEVDIENELTFNEEYSNSIKNIVHHKNINLQDNTPENLFKATSDRIKKFNLFTSNNEAKKNTTKDKSSKESLTFRNHKITKIEYLSERIDTGCITIDGEERYHNHHTFALSVGIYTVNSMLEDYWLPRRGSGKGTEVQQLAGGANLSAIEDISYFQEKLFRSLNVPFSRLKTDDQWGIGQASQISRDEVRFSKFIYKLRNKFNQLFDDLLKRQLILKGIINEDDWEVISSKIKFEYANDSFFSELKNMEIIKERFNLLGEIDQYTTNGISPTKTPYLSIEWVKKNVLRQDEKEIKKTAKEVKEELEESQKLIPSPGTEDPNAQDPLSGLDDIENGTDATPESQAPVDPNQALDTQKGAQQNLNSKQPKKETPDKEELDVEKPKRFRKNAGLKRIHKNPK